MAIEVLAPVGNMDMFQAALAAGADAIFLASKDFGARAYANNFNLEEIGDIVRTCSSRGVRVHVTVNTLIKEAEMDQALNLVARLYEIGVDAIIVQDLGLLAVASQTFPNMEFHCSTQLSANSSQAVNFLAGLGARRVILARELSYQEIEEIGKNTQIDLEVFGHGSICVSYSGKCTMSSFIGGRSGNRGRCAQPCRKEYQLLKPSMEVIEQGYFLSPKDLAAGQGVRRLEEIGVRSIKIEGRMKKPDYVYATVKYYKDLLTGRPAKKAMVKEATGRATTGGILEGARARDFVDVGRDEARGFRVGKITGQGRYKYISLQEDVKKQDGLEISLENKKLTITTDKGYPAASQIKLDKFPDALEGTGVYRVSSAQLRDLDYWSLAQDQNQPISFSLYAYKGQKPRLLARAQGRQVDLELDEPLEEGKNLVVDQAYAAKQLSKLGGTGYYLDRLDLVTDGRAFMPASMLNELRRLAIEGLEKQLTIRDRLVKIHIKKGQPAEQKEASSLALDVWDERALDYDWDELFLRDLKGARRLSGKKIFYELPMVIKDQDYQYFKEIIQDNIDILDGLVVANAWDLRLGDDFPGLELIVSEYANSFNSLAVEVLKGSGADRLILSTELSIDEAQEIDKTLPLGLVIFSRPIEMIMDHCPASVLGCDFACQTCRYSRGHYIRNEEGDTYSFKRYWARRTELKNIQPISAVHYKDRLAEAGFKNFIYRIDQDDDYQVLASKEPRGQGVRKGHFEKGVL